MCRTRHKTCNQCVRDPYCGWDPEQQECRPYSTGVFTSQFMINTCTSMYIVILYADITCHNTTYTWAYKYLYHITKLYYPLTGFIQDVAGQMPSACAASLKRREIRAFWGETLHLATCVDPQRHPQGQPPQWRHNGVEVTMGPRKFLTWDGGLVRDVAY